MNKSMTAADLIGLGFMTFAFFLGAGNIIFPPMAGFMAGEHLTLAMLGFLVTAVGLPLATIIAVAKAGGGLLTMTRHLPAGMGVAMAVAVYFIIGPAFATPRTGLVAYEMGIKPFLGDAANQTSLALFSLGYFGLATFLSLKPGRLLDAIGKLITPLLVILLVVLSVAILVAPQGSVPLAAGEYVSHPGVKGLMEGYNTMDTFGALMFGMLIIDVLKAKGIHDRKLQTRYLVRAGMIAATGLALVYMALFKLGGTAGGLLESPENGGVIVATYVQALFGSTGQLILAAIVSLACLTTAVGLISACADFFSNLWPRCSYRSLALAMGVLCALVANVGLATLISLSIPVLVGIYPVAVALVLATLLQGFFAYPRHSLRCIIAIALLFGALDGLKAAGLDLSAFDFLPLFDLGLAWLLPTSLVTVLCLVMPRRAVVSNAA